MIALPAHPDDLFRCPVHDCTLRARVCIARLVNSGRRLGRLDLARRSTSRKRGLNLDFPLCRSDRCALGRAILRALGPECAASVREGFRPDFGEQGAKLQRWLRDEAPVP